MGLRKEGVEIVSCPTCGRTCTDLLSAANRVEHELSSLIPKGKYLKVAVMGCIVNGPGEAAEADIGVAAPCSREVSSSGRCRWKPL